MASVSLTGSDIIKVGSRVLFDFADADNATLTFPNELAALKTGKNGNSIYAFNTTGAQVDLVLRIMRASSDDKYLNGLLSAMKRDFAGFVLVPAQVTKVVGNGLGFRNMDTYILAGGIFARQVDALSNVEGNTDQSISVYTLRFSNSTRAIF